MIFRNRSEAGQALATLLSRYANQDEVRVLGIPRGGVPVAFEIALALGAPLDVFVIRKLGVPWQQELAFGALASGGVRVLDEGIMLMAGLSNSDAEQAAARETAELERRERVYRGGKPPLDVRGRTVILVDDGIATGSSMKAAIGALRQRKPALLVVAVPVAPPAAIREIRLLVDELVCVYIPETLYAVGQYYLDFSPVSDEEVTERLRRAACGPTESAVSKC